MCHIQNIDSERFLIFTTPWAYSSDDKLLIFFLFLPESRLWPFMQIVSFRDNLYERSELIFWKKKIRNISKYRLKFLPRVLSVLETICMKFQSLFSGKKNEKYFKISSEFFYLEY